MFKGLTDFGREYSIVGLKNFSSDINFPSIGMLFRVLYKGRIERECDTLPYQREFWKEFFNQTKLENFEF